MTRRKSLRSQLAEKLIHRIPNRSETDTLIMEWFPERDLA